MTDSMNVENYKRLLKAFEDKGYRFGRFDGLGPDYTAVLRHDIDFSLKYALKVAEIEAARGFSAYYFILLTTNFYNAFSSQGRKILLRIKELGHELGVHFDPTVYNDILSFHTKNRGSMLWLAKFALTSILNGIFQHQPQSEESPTYYPKRTPEDGGIDWSLSSLDIVCLVRAVAPPCLGAFASLGVQIIKLLACKEFERSIFSSNIFPETILNISHSTDSFVVKQAMARFL